MFNYSQNPFGGPLDGPLPPFRGMGTPKDSHLRLALSERLCSTEKRHLQPPPAPEPYVRSYLANSEPEPPVPDKNWKAPKPEWYVRPETVSNGDELFKILAFAKCALSPSSANTPPFKRTRQGWEATSRVGMSLLDALPCLERWAQIHGSRQEIQFDQHVQLSLEVFMATGLGQGTPMGPIGMTSNWYVLGLAFDSVANLCNAYVQYFRQCAQKLNVAREIQKHLDRHAAQAREVRSYLANLGKRHPACSVKRVELCMKRSTTMSDREEWTLMLKEGDAFVGSVKKMFGTAVVGHVRKIDGGSTSSFLVHILLAFDGPNEQELAAIDEALPQLCDEQTSGLGYLVNCKDVASFVYRGTGSAAQPYETTASMLDKAATYLADTDRMVHVGFRDAPDGLILGLVPR